MYTFEHDINNLSYWWAKLFINDLKCKPNIIGISECGLIKNKPPLTNIDLPNFCFEFTPAETRKGGTIIYIHKNLRYKRRKDLNFYKPNTRKKRDNANGWL